jgi:hypothetical protein
MAKRLAKAGSGEGGRVRGECRASPPSSGYLSFSMAPVEAGAAGIMWGA